jgi:hypothetical protein
MAPSSMNLADGLKRLLGVSVQGYQSAANLLDESGRRVYAGFSRGRPAEETTMKTILILAVICSTLGFGQGFGPCPNNPQLLQPYCFTPAPPLNPTIPQPAPDRGREQREERERRDRDRQEQQLQRERKEPGHCVILPNGQEVCR